MSLSDRLMDAACVTLVAGAIAAGASYHYDEQAKSLEPRIRHYGVIEHSVSDDAIAMSARENDPLPRRVVERIEAYRVSSERSLSLARAAGLALAVGGGLAAFGFVYPDPVSEREHL